MKILFLISLGLILSLSSCVYKMDIEQGNAIDREKLEKLEIGMSKKQVLFLLGKPAIKDSFHQNKWHYLRTLKNNNGKNHQQKTMILEFNGDTLSHIKGSL